MPSPSRPPRATRILHITYPSALGDMRAVVHRIGHASRLDVPEDGARWIGTHRVTVNGIPRATLYASTAQEAARVAADLLRVENLRALAAGLRLSTERLQDIRTTPPAALYARNTHPGVHVRAVRVCDLAHLAAGPTDRETIAQDSRMLLILCTHSGYVIETRTTHQAHPTMHVERTADAMILTRDPIKGTGYATETARDGVPRQSFL